jgi:hypothetical protein
MDYHGFTRGLGNVKLASDFSMRHEWLFLLRFIRSCCNNSQAHHIFIQAYSAYSDEVCTAWGLDFDKTVARRLLTELWAENKWSRGYGSRLLPFIRGSQDDPEVPGLCL